MWKVMIWFCALVCLNALAPGQTTQPTGVKERQWNQIVNRFAIALVDGDIAGASQNCASIPHIRSLDDQSSGDFSSITARISGGKIISARTYLQTPVTLASDLADDFGNALDLPAFVRGRMKLANESELIRANEIARLWLNDTLHPGDRSPIGVIVVWPQIAEHIGIATTPVFLLIRGTESSDNHFEITHAVFGVPLK